MSTLENPELYTRIWTQTHNQQLYLSNRLQRIDYNNCISSNSLFETNIRILN